MSVNLTPEDKARLIELIAANAITAPANVGVEGYFRGLIVGANLPNEFKQQRIGGWTGSAKFDAQELVNWALARELNPEDRRYTTIASILEPELSRSGFETASTLVALIFAYRLVRDNRLLDRLAMRYQVPRPAEAELEVGFGPAIDWKGPEEPGELQGLFRPDPTLLDVGFLKRGIERTTSVCRIEIGGLGAQGTGVLIDSDLVLTNYHVLGDSDDKVRDAARQTTLRFGAFTSFVGKESEGQAVGLDPKEAVVALSPVEAHDFVLLRTTEAIHQAKDVAPVRFVVRQPARGSGVNILQHPEGQPMMLSLSSNGVTSLLEDRGLVQYVSRTAGGSSGSPCLDDDWNMVALHHAARSKFWGIAGEGILMSSLYPLLQRHLNAKPA